MQSQDKQIQEWQKSSIRYDPPLRHNIRYDFEYDNTVVYTLRGPRQVGKTTLIKLQIQEFLSDRLISPWNIFYYSFDLIQTRSEMVEIIETYLRLCKKYRDTSKRTCLFLDEVSAIKEWQKGIKWIIDQNLLENCTVLATGSHAANIINAAERLPGRKGRIKDPHHRLLRPMTFSEFVRIQDKDIREFMQESPLYEPSSKDKFLQQLYSKEIPEQADQLYNNFSTELGDYFYEYMLTGGIPKIVDEKNKNGVIASELYADYLDGLKGDWGLQRNEALLKQFAAAIINSAGYTISWDSLRQQAQLGSWSTSQEYASSLKELAIISIIHRYNTRKKIAITAKEKKIYFHDPFYMHMFHSWINPSDPFEVSEEFMADSIN